MLCRQPTHFKKNEFNSAPLPQLAKLARVLGPLIRQSHNFDFVTEQVITTIDRTIQELQPPVMIDCLLDKISANSIGADNIAEIHKHSKQLKQAMDKVCVRWTELRQLYPDQHTLSHSQAMQAMCADNDISGLWSCVDNLKQAVRNANYSTNDAKEEAFDQLDQIFLWCINCHPTHAFAYMHLKEYMSNLVRQLHRKCNQDSLQSPINVTTLVDTQTVKAATATLTRQQLEAGCSWHEILSVAPPGNTRVCNMLADIDPMLCSMSDLCQLCAELMQITDKFNNPQTQTLVMHTLIAQYLLPNQNLMQSDNLLKFRVERLRHIPWSVQTNTQTSADTVLLESIFDQHWTTSLLQRLKNTTGTLAGLSPTTLNSCATIQSELTTNLAPLTLPEITASHTHVKTELASMKRKQNNALYAIEIAELCSSICAHHSEASQSLTTAINKYSELLSESQDKCSDLYHTHKTLRSCIAHTAKSIERVYDDLTEAYLPNVNQSEFAKLQALCDELMLARAGYEHLHAKLCVPKPVLSTSIPSETALTCLLSEPLQFATPSSARPKCKISLLSALSELQDIFAQTKPTAWNQAGRDKISKIIEMLQSIDNVLQGNPTMKISIVRKTVSVFDFQCQLRKLAQVMQLLHEFVNKNHVKYDTKSGWICNTVPSHPWPSARSFACAILTQQQAATNVNDAIQLLLKFLNVCTDLVHCYTNLLFEKQIAQLKSSAKSSKGNKTEAQGTPKQYKPSTKPVQDEPSAQNWSLLKQTIQPVPQQSIDTFVLNKQMCRFAAQIANPDASQHVLTDDFSDELPLGFVDGNLSTLALAHAACISQSDDRFVAPNTPADLMILDNMLRASQSDKATNRACNLVFILQCLKLMKKQTDVATEFKNTRTSEPNATEKIPLLIQQAQDIKKDLQTLCATNTVACQSFAAYVNRERSSNPGIVDNLLLTYGNLMQGVIDNCTLKIQIKSIEAYAQTYPLATIQEFMHHCKMSKIKKTIHNYSRQLNADGLALTDNLHNVNESVDNTLSEYAASLVELHDTQHEYLLQQIAIQAVKCVPIHLAVSYLQPECAVYYLCYLWIQPTFVMPCANAPEKKQYFDHIAIPIDAQEACDVVNRTPRGQACVLKLMLQSLQHITVASNYYQMCYKHDYFGPIVVTQEVAHCAKSNSQNMMSLIRNNMIPIARVSESLHTSTHEPVDPLPIDTRTGAIQLLHNHNCKQSAKRAEGPCASLHDPNNALANLKAAIDAYTAAEGFTEEQTAKANELFSVGLVPENALQIVKAYVQNVQPKHTNCALQEVVDSYDLYKQTLQSNGVPAISTDCNSYCHNPLATEEMLHAVQCMPAPVTSYVLANIADQLLNNLTTAVCLYQFIKLSQTKHTADLQMLLHNTIQLTSAWFINILKHALLLPPGSLRHFQSMTREMRDTLHMHNNHADEQDLHTTELVLDNVCDMMHSIAAHNDEQFLAQFDQNHTTLLAKLHESKVLKPLFHDLCNDIFRYVGDDVFGKSTTDNIDLSDVNIEDLEPCDLADAPTEANPHATSAPIEHMDDHSVTHMDDNPVTHMDDDPMTHVEHTGANLHATSASKEHQQRTELPTSAPKVPTDSIYQLFAQTTSFEDLKRACYAEPEFKNSAIILVQTLVTFASVEIGTMIDERLLYNTPDTFKSRLIANNANPEQYLDTFVSTCKQQSCNLDEIMQNIVQRLVHKCQHTGSAIPFEIETSSPDCLTLWQNLKFPLGQMFDTTHRQAALCLARYCSTLLNDLVRHAADYAAKYSAGSVQAAFAAAVINSNTLTTFVKTQLAAIFSMQSPAVRKRPNNDHKEVTHKKQKKLADLSTPAAHTGPREISTFFKNAKVVEKAKDGTAQDFEGAVEKAKKSPRGIFYKIKWSTNETSYIPFHKLKQIVVPQEVDVSLSIPIVCQNKHANLQFVDKPTKCKLYAYVVYTDGNTQIKTGASDFASECNDPQKNWKKSFKVQEGHEWVRVNLPFDLESVCTLPKALLENEQTTKPAVPTPQPTAPEQHTTDRYALHSDTMHKHESNTEQQISTGFCYVCQEEDVEIELCPQCKRNAKEPITSGMCGTCVNTLHTTLAEFKCPMCNKRWSFRLSHLEMRPTLEGLCNNKAFKHRQHDAEIVLCGNCKQSQQHNEPLPDKCEFCTIACKNCDSFRYYKKNQ